jgi:phosphoadenosine phosphosulfate reductase
LNIVDLKSTVPKNMQRDANGNLYFASDPDFCCHINKVQPMDSLLLEYDIWINGVRADQNANRKSMKIEQDGPHGSKRYHPVLDWTTKEIFEYAKKYNLPKHPLEDKGYLSVGCEPCTRKFDFGDVRTSRWFGMKKTECGLHTDLAKK